MRVSTTKTTVTLSVDISLNLRVFEGREHDREFVLHFHQDKGATTLYVGSIPSPSIAPPGHYMQWLIDADGLPCNLAPFVRIV